MERKIVAVGLLTQAEVDLLGVSFTRLWPVDKAPQFEDLIEAIDRVDRDSGGSEVEPRERP